MPTCLRAYVPTCLRAYVPTCLRAYVPKCLYDVPFRALVVKEEICDSCCVPTQHSYSNDHTFHLDADGILIMLRVYRVLVCLRYTYLL